MSTDNISEPGSLHGARPTLKRSYQRVDAARFGFIAVNGGKSSAELCNIRGKHGEQCSNSQRRHYHCERPDCFFTTHKSDKVEAHAASHTRLAGRGEQRFMC
jgi:hypothetical protein